MARFLPISFYAVLSGFALLVPQVLRASDPQLEGRPQRLEPIQHRNPGLTVDLGLGLWGTAIPCDRNGDGLPDLILVAASSSQNGVYYFENSGRRDPETGMEIFKPGIRLSDGRVDLTPSYTPGGLRVLAGGNEYRGFLEHGIANPVSLDVSRKAIHSPTGRLRGIQWSYVDFYGSGKLDLVVGMGDWTDYGWDAAYDANGRWINGPLHGYVHVLKNTGTNEKPVYAPAKRLTVDGRDLDVYGTPSPVFADFRRTGKLDLICGEFIDGLTFFENRGTREEPDYAPGRRLRFQGEPLSMPGCMIVVTAYDWNNDGLPDLVVSQEDGRVAWLENTGRIVDGMPEFAPPRFFRQEADFVRFGVLSAPVSIDWDGDGLADILTGNADGEIAFIKNLEGSPPRWAAPVHLEADGKPIRMTAGYNGSIQGPAEAKWGYTNIGAGDWDGDGLPDIVASTITGKIVWFRNIGTRTEPKLAAAEPLQVTWEGTPPKPAWNWWDPAPGELVVQWRCTPLLIDLDGDGITDLVTLDHEGHLAWFRQVIREGKRVLLPGQRIFKQKVDPVAHDGRSVLPLRLSRKTGGQSGRRTFCFVDWDGDGKLDLLVNSANVNFYRNVGTGPGDWTFADEGPLDGRKLAGHSTCPTPVNWDNSPLSDLLVGAEDGYFYFLRNPHQPPDRTGKSAVPENR